MKKLLIGAGTALTALALAGGGVSAQTSYVLEGELSVAGASTCTTVTDPPQLDYTVTYEEALSENFSITLSFTADGAAFGTPVDVQQNFSGVIPFPTNGNGSPGGYVNEGWTIQAGLWFDGPDADVHIVATVVDADGTVTAKAPITYDFEGCLDAAPPPQPPTPTPPPAPPVPPGPPSVTPTPPVPPQAAPPLPSAGLSTFETGMRIGALLLIGGLGFVIVAKRRRFAAVTSAST